MRKGIKRMLLGLLFMILGLQISIICVAFGRPMMIHLSFILILPGILLAMNGYVQED